MSEIIPGVPAIWRFSKATGWEQQVMDSDLQSKVAQATQLLCVLNPAVSTEFAAYALGLWVAGQWQPLVETFNLPRASIRDICDVDALIGLLASIGVTPEVLKQE